MFCYYGMMSNLPVYEPSSYLFPTGYGTLGYGLPAGIGAKVANDNYFINSAHNISLLVW